MQSPDLLVPSIARVCASVWQHLVRAKITPDTLVVRMCVLELVWMHVCACKVEEDVWVDKLLPLSINSAKFSGKLHVSILRPFSIFNLSQHLFPSCFFLSSLFFVHVSAYPTTLSPLSSLLPPHTCSLREAIYLNYTPHCAPTCSQISPSFFPSLWL